MVTDRKDLAQVESTRPPVYAVPLGGPIGDVTLTKVRIRKGTPTESVHQTVFGRGRRGPVSGHPGDAD
jgi:hypothetical protein